MVLTTRRLTGGDVAAWRALRLEGIRDYPTAFLSTTEEVLSVPEAELAGRLEQGQSFGIFDDQALVGTCALVQGHHARARHRAEIGGFFIRPAYHGTVAADSLMTALVEAAGGAGVWQLELFVNTDNTRAIRFYERHGFRREGRMPNAVISSAGPEHDWFYVRDLRG